MNPSAENVDIVNRTQKFSNSPATGKCRIAEPQKSSNENSEIFPVKNQKFLLQKFNLNNFQQLLNAEFKMQRLQKK